MDYHSMFRSEIEETMNLENLTVVTQVPNA